MSEPPTVHASCVAFGADGVLIRGASGSGKSTLALDLVRWARSERRFGRLVADDRVRVEAVSGRLVASPPAALAGLVEIRGVGVVAAPSLSAVVVRLVVDLVDAPERLPAPEELRTILAGITLPRLAVAARSAAARPLASQAIAHHLSEGRCGSSALAFAPQHEKLPPPAPVAPLF